MSTAILRRTSTHPTNYLLVLRKEEPSACNSVYVFGHGSYSAQIALLFGCVKIGLGRWQRELFQQVDLKAAGGGGTTRA